MKIFLRGIAKSGLRIACHILSLVWPYNAAVAFKNLMHRAHTFWLAREFNSLGDDSNIQFPINLKGAKFINIGNNVTIGKRSILNAWSKYQEYVYHPAIIIGDNTAIGEDCHITAVNGIEIGKNVLIGKKVTITDNAHGEVTGDAIDLPPVDRKLNSKGRVKIEDQVWIGDKATILPNVRIGANAIIGANALVTKDIPANCVAGGVPARVIKTIR